MALQATASPLVHRYTLEEFFGLDAPPSGGHYELIAGVLYMVPPPDWRHNWAASRLNTVLAVYAAAHPDRCVLFVPRAPIWTNNATYLEPDMFLVRTENLEAQKKQMTTAALVVEILSPSTGVYDRTAKADTYAALGVEELWLVDLATQSIEQQVRKADVWQVKGIFAGDSAFEATTFPDLTVVPDRMFVA